MIYWTYSSSAGNVYYVPRFWLWSLPSEGYGHLYDAVWTLGTAPWLEFDFMVVFGCFYPVWILGTIIFINLDGKDTTYGSVGQERLWPTINGRSLGAWKSACSNMVFFSHFKTFSIFVVSVAMSMAYFRWTMLIADDHTLKYASSEANRNNFVYGMARCGFIVLLAFVLMLICGNVFLYQGMINKYKESAKLVSAEGFKTRLKKVYASRFHFNLLIGSWFLLYTFLLPQGMAMQMFGVSQPEAWPSLVQWGFDVKGSPTNMLGAPLHRLAVRSVAHYVWFRSLRFVTRSTVSNTAR